jgi:hypothetical protein
MSSRTSLRKLFKLSKRKSRKISIAPQSISNDSEWLMPTEPRSMKQGRGWVSSVRWNQNVATHEAMASMAAEQRLHATTTTAVKNKAGRDMGSELQNKLIRESTRVSSQASAQGPKLPRRNVMPSMRPDETEPREFYVTLNNMPVTPAKTPVKSKSRQRRTPRLTPGTPYERVDNGGTPSPAKSAHRSRKQLTPPPKFNNMTN